jgi:recombination protein RecT
MEANQEKKQGEQTGSMFTGTAGAAGVTPIKVETTKAAATAPAVATPPAPAAVQPKTQAAALRDIQNETTVKVLEHVQALQEAGDLKLPENYAAGNQVKLAWLNLLEVTDRNGNPALQVCTKESIANALLEMLVKGLSVAKKQCDFIVYGNKLTLQEEYHGTIAIARRVGGVVGVPTGNVIYEGDDFVYSIDPKTGRKYIVKHEQDFMNIDMNKIKGAYATIQLSDGSTHVEIMNMNQIRQAWMQGATKGQSPAHKNFPDQMAIKTVISRGCKLFISTSDDSGLYKPLGEENSEEMPKTKPDVKQPKEAKRTLEIQDIPHTEIKEQPNPIVKDDAAADKPGF